MDITYLSIAEIKELQPTETANAEKFTRVAGGVEVTGEIDHEELADKIQDHFGVLAQPWGEGHDGDKCVHFVVVYCNTRS